MFHGGGLCEGAFLHGFFQPFHKADHDDSVADMSGPGLGDLHFIFYCLQFQNGVRGIKDLRAVLGKDLKEAVIGLGF